MRVAKINKEEIKTKIEVRKSQTSITVVERHYNKLGLEVSGNGLESRLGVLNFDSEVMSKDEAFAYAKTRKWGFSDEPVNPRQSPNLYELVDLGPIEEEAEKPVSVEEGAGTLEQQ